MRWSSAAARGLQRPTTVMITNHSDEVSEQSGSTEPAMAAAVLNEEVFLGIDTASVRHVVARFVLGEGVKPAEGMTTATLLARVRSGARPEPPCTACMKRGRRA